MLLNNENSFTFRSIDEFNQVWNSEFYQLIDTICKKYIKPFLLHQQSGSDVDHISMPDIITDSHTTVYMAISSSRTDSSVMEHTDVILLKHILFVSITDDHMVLEAFAQLVFYALLKINPRFINYISVEVDKQNYSSKIKVSLKRNKVEYETQPISSYIVSGFSKRKEYPEYLQYSSNVSYKILNLFRDQNLVDNFFAPYLTKLSNFMKRLMPDIPSSESSILDERTIRIPEAIIYSKYTGENTTSVIIQQILASAMTNYLYHLVYEFSVRSYKQYLHFISVTITLTNSGYFVMKFNLSTDSSNRYRMIYLPNDTYTSMYGGFSAAISVHQLNTGRTLRGIFGSAMPPDLTIRRQYFHNHSVEDTILDIVDSDNTSPVEVTNQPVPNNNTKTYKIDTSQVLIISDPADLKLMSNNNRDIYSLTQADLPFGCDLISKIGQENLMLGTCWILQIDRNDVAIKFRHLPDYKDMIFYLKKYHWTERQ